jgi:hypothetical protein
VVTVPKDFGAELMGRAPASPAPDTPEVTRDSVPPGDTGGPTAPASAGESAVPANTGGPAVPANAGVPTVPANIGEPTVPADTGNRGWQGLPNATSRTWGPESTLGQASGNPSLTPAPIPEPGLSLVPAGTTIPAFEPEPSVAPATLAETRGTPARTVPAVARRPMPPGAVSIRGELAVGRTGLTLWNEPQLVRQLMPRPAGSPEEPPEPQGPWTLSGDLEKYRAHAVKDGSRSTPESLKKALERAGLAIGDGANVFLLGYASDRAKPFRQNDGKGLFQEPGKVPERAGATIGNLGYALYSLVDLATLNALPDPNQAPYKDNNPLVRPLLFTGRTIGGAWKTTEEVGNALTWGLFDNVTGCIGLVIEDVVEFIKHAGEAVTNVVRAPFHVAGGKKSHEKTDEALDWVLLVPLELVSNAVEMKGISNMEDYKSAFASKGVIGSVLEFGGSTYIVYRAVDKLADEHRDSNHSSHHDQGGSSGGSSGNNGPSPDHPAPPLPEVPDEPTGGWIIFNPDGTINSAYD